ncbi:MAG: 16S rRNA (guanine(527)-N(7))-methyltransferase RsmG [Gammaproteobacteria bacterium]
MPHEKADQILEYQALLELWNRRFNLTAIRDPYRMVTEHLLDALSIATAIKGTRVIDVGTGAGLPGLVLAIYAPERETVLLDSNGKKTRFLREAVRLLGLDNVEIQSKRSEDYRPDAGFDTVMCRAFAPLPRLIEVASHLRAPDGILLAQKGQYPTAEVEQLGDTWQVQSTPLTVPGLDKTRHLLLLRPTQNA